MKETNKVYCKDCKWNSILFCYPPKERKEDDYCSCGNPWILPSCMKKFEGQHREELNEDGNCQYYKRKWWKFVARVREIKDHEDCHVV